MNVSDLITQAEAARLRGVTRATISALVKKGRFKTFSIAGQQFLSRTQVVSFVPHVGGRPANHGKKKTARQ
jgi:predicted XRE-type DNA-binding protein